MLTFRKLAADTVPEYVYVTVPGTTFVTGSSEGRYVVTFPDGTFPGNVNVMLEYGLTYLTGPTLFSSGAGPTTPGGGLSHVLILFPGTVEARILYGAPAQLIFSLYL